MATQRRTLMAHERLCCDCVSNRDPKQLEGMPGTWLCGLGKTSYIGEKPTRKTSLLGCDKFAHQAEALECTT